MTPTPIMFTLTEQDEIMNEFSNPLDFIRNYIDIYSKQIDVPVKVYLDDIQYYQRFESLFLDMVLKQSLSTDEGDLNFPEVERLLDEFHNMRFHDERFYLECTLVLIKGIAIILDRVDQEIQNHDFSNVKYLYYYTGEPIDLSRILIDGCSRYISDFQVVIKKMSELKDVIHDINEELNELGRSPLVNDKRLKDRMNLSERMIGSRRVEGYDVNEMYGHIFDLIMVRAGGMEMNEGYMYIMDFCSEYLTCELGDEESINGLKDYCNVLLSREEKE